MSKRRGRPPRTTAASDHRITVTCTAAEQRRWRALAVVKNRPLAVLIRELLDRASGR